MARKATARTEDFPPKVGDLEGTAEELQEMKRSIARRETWGPLGRLVNRAMEAGRGVRNLVSHRREVMRDLRGGADQAWRAIKEGVRAARSHARAS